MKPAQRPVVIYPRFAHADELLDNVRLAATLGVDQIWLPQEPDQRDATVTANGYLHAAPNATVGTAVLPVYPRHPVAMAQAALTLADFSDGRFILGLGYSHKFINEYMLGYEQGPPIGVMREYLAIVRGLIRDGSIAYEGRHFTARAQYAGFRHPVPVFLAALRPQMIRLAVEHGDGIVLWLCTPRFVRERITPHVEKACVEFGKDPADFQVVTVLPTHTGADADQALARFSQTVKAYRLIPYYRGVLEAYGDIDPEQLSLIGTEEHIRARMQEFREAGCTPVIAPSADTPEQFTAAVLAAYGEQAS